MGNGPGGRGGGYGGGGMDPGGFHGAMGHGGGGDWAQWLAIPTLIFVIIAVALAAWSTYMLWKMRRDANAPAAASDAEAVLAARLAKGEIGADDYTRRIAVLRGAPAADAADTTPIP